MEDIFFYHVCDYIDNKTFKEMNLSILCKMNTLKKRQKYINRTLAAKKLKNALWENELNDIIHVVLDDYYLFIKYISNILLKDISFEYYEIQNKYERNKIFVKKYIMSNTIIDFNSKNKIINIDFETGQDIVDDVFICSIYRLGIAKKQIVLDTCPMAKALIY